MLSFLLPVTEENRRLGAVEIGLTHEGDNLEGYDDDEEDVEHNDVSPDSKKKESPRESAPVFLDEKAVELVAEKPTEVVDGQSALPLPPSPFPPYRCTLCYTRRTSGIT